MQAIGLTGGIGSGKSTIARIFRQMGYPVYIADSEASRLMNIHPDIRREMIRKFGELIYTGNGTLNKPLLATIIFDDRQTLREVNHIVHPRVMEDFRNWCEKQSGDLVFFESAILFETGLNAFFTSIICVSASLELRIQRVVKRDHTTTDKVKERIANQLNDAEKCQKSDFIIYNDDEHHVIEQIMAVLEKLENNK